MCIVGVSQDKRNIVSIIAKIVPSKDIEESNYQYINLMCEATSVTIKPKHIMVSGVNRENDTNTHIYTERGIGKDRKRRQIL